MNKSSIDQLVSQYLTSVNTIGATSATATNTAPVTSNIGSLTNANAYYYPYRNTISYDSSATTWWASYGNPFVTKVLDTMPLILKIKNVSVDGNKIEITFDKFSHKNLDKFLPDQGSVYFGQEIYGVYDKADYLYWEDTLKIQVEDIEEALKVIKKGILFTTVNNWDEKITNQEIFLFLKNIKSYKRYAHLMLEMLLEESEEPRNLKQRMDIHSELESKLI